MKMSLEHLVESYDGGKPKYSEINLSSATIPPQIVWAGLELNLGHRGERLAIEYLNCDRTLKVIYKYSVRTAQ